ncbi:putative Ig-like domain-containing protein [Bacillus phage Izhevsk]|uniref:Putative Ig-like domain-containing protein n=1 Tax=Bacillus phage Izhevsk TaxID=2724322 RepID=A0A6H0X6D0_9CAUD|nr:putative Ig-like domain-containing protein [Bacillus phage Izhevsk]QIW89874.1 putative Ig-like domain-containing protein [Bacillus phage Izhevsk]
MANFINIILDTTAPSNPYVNINGGATYSNSQLVSVTIGTTDEDTTGYQMKIWGTVDPAYDTNIQATEVTSTWISYTDSKQIKLSSGDGNKQVSVRIRDDVYNESSVAQDNISLNTAIPTVNVGAPDKYKISKKEQKNVVSFTFSSPEQFEEYKVKVVTSTGAVESSGVTIGTINGSSNIAGNTGGYTNPITVTITGQDLELASSGDGNKIIKVFVKNSAGTWSV